ncbi:MAG TPA: response regulator [Steroidobacteraceae bacterium]|nr:response regulator [Steroidobacteraceae bacterium]
MPQAPRVLIVEDQYFVAVDCELQLRSVGIECVGLATTASEALDIAEREHPDFALMDIRLASVADGVEAAIVLYERFGIRCIFASAHADPATRKLAERAHPLGWLDKPYTGGQLVATVRECLGALPALTPDPATAPQPSSRAVH